MENLATAPQKYAKTRQNARISRHRPINFVYAVDRVRRQRHVMTCKVMLRQDEKAALLRSPLLISHKSAVDAHVGRDCQQTKAVNRKNGGLKQNFWAAKAPISNWPAVAGIADSAGDAVIVPQDPLPLVPGWSR